MKILVTGGAGFIGSNYVHFVLDHTDDDVVVLDKLTYAGNLRNLQDVAENSRFRFVQGDIADPQIVQLAMQDIGAVVNFAAESHVDRSILDPAGSITTNVVGVYTLLEAARKAGVQRFVQVSTDEVYGEVPEGSVAEMEPLRPRSPYSAGKAGGDLLSYAYYTTYKLPTMATRGSNTFGPFQYPEKLIPVVITEAIDHHPVPVYGAGLQVRDWLFVEDHCSGIDLVLRQGEPGQAYNIGGGNERQNLDVIERILDILDRPRSLIQHVVDRPGHDVRYCVDSSRLQTLGWQPSREFEAALEQTIHWYVEHEDWWRPLKNRQDYVEYFQRNYGARSSAG